MNTQLFDSPIGRLSLRATADAITAIDFIPSAGEESMGPLQSAPILAELARQLEEYFQGRRKGFAIPFSVGEGSHGSIWTNLLQLPYGETLSYKEFASRVGKPRAFRSVASIIGKNPLPILLPCHRVIGADGALRGFRGGLDAKRWLLHMEGWRRCSQ